MPDVDAGFVFGAFVAGDDKLAGPGKDDIGDVRVGNELACRFPGFAVDHVNRPIGAGGGDIAAIGRDGEGDDGARVAGEAGDFAIGAFAAGLGGGGGGL